MYRNRLKAFSSWPQWLLPILTGPCALAFVPAISLASFWLGGEPALIAAAALFPLAFLISGAGLDGGAAPRRRDADCGPLPRSAFEQFCEATYVRCRDEAAQSALFVFTLTDIDQITERHGPAAAERVVNRIGERLISAMRAADVVGQIGDHRFGICLAPIRHLDLEACIQMAGRMQVTIEEPVSIDGVSIYVSAAIGFCQQSRCPGQKGRNWLPAASTALQEARRRGPASIRAFSDQMRRDSENRAELRMEVAQALETGQIQPWFQPQISTDTGQITGFEALARWSHPTRGMISPAEFLPMMEEAGLLERLAEIMMYHSFATLKAWDGAGVDVPQIGVNFTGSELSNPRLIDKIKWELDRFDLSPDRLAIEVLETVVASAPDDVITRNINALGKLGCRIDLDDFGTGHASIASIRRFSVSRIKIDRSFVMKADRDPEQQRMISAILTMADRLDLETLAEGVESVGEHVLLAQLGCDHVQGYGIARPMPFEQTLDWIARHEQKLQDVPRLLDGKAN